MPDDILSTISFGKTARMPDRIHSKLSLNRHWLTAAACLSSIFISIEMKGLERDLFPFENTVIEQADTTAVLEEEMETSYVTAAAEEKTISGVMSGDLRLNMEKLSVLPRMLGNTDLIKTIQLMPGIQISGEMNSGIYIRGADAGHNSVLFDGAPVYNASHLMGFFSVFNSNHISASTLHKSNIPSEFGGRLSGVLDVSSRNEIPERFTGNIDAGILSSQATLGIPLGKKSGLYLSGRFSYLNYILNSIENMMNGADAPNYFFDDFNLSWVLSPDEDNSIRVNAYYGSDRLDFSQSTYQAGAGLQWHNATCSGI